ncbi:hypothetical protein [Candidatus Palauibacter sp.]|uniref:hypothetical protein n=1 Tax=Candidatus Palauibacter sp. TaxID=3101350 RepID=UPI003B01A595
MRNLMRFGLVVFCGFAGGLAAPDPVVAQDCAMCKKCSDCDRSEYGASSCDFKGEGEDGKGCCQMTGEVCNPTLSLNVAGTDLRLARVDHEQTLVARLEDNVFGTWTCGDGSLRVAYREVNGGALIEIDGAELTVLKERYPLKTYVGLLGESRATYAASPS